MSNFQFCPLLFDHFYNIDQNSTRVDCCLTNWPVDQLTTLSDANTWQSALSLSKIKVSTMEEWVRAAAFPWLTVRWPSSVLWRGTDAWWLLTRLDVLRRCMEFFDAKMVDSKLVQVLSWLLLRGVGANMSCCSDLVCVLAFTTRIWWRTMLLLR